MGFIPDREFHTGLCLKGCEVYICIEYGAYLMREHRHHIWMRRYEMSIKAKNIEGEKTDVGCGLKCSQSSIFPGWDIPGL